MTRAVIYVPQLYEVARYVATCMEHCARHGYDVTGVVHGNWPAAAAMLNGGTVSVLVIARPDHLAPDRQPRVEVADEPPADGSPRSRRTQLIRRAGAE